MNARACPAPGPVAARRTPPLAPALALIVALAATDTVVAQEGTLCPLPEDTSARITVDAPSPELTALACGASADALAHLGGCGLTLSSAVHVVLVEEVGTSHVECLAQYDCDLRRMEVLTPGALAETVSPDRPTGRIPPETLFAALIVHEFTHATLAEALPPGELSTVDHEYLAYALQIASLPEPARAIFLEPLGEDDSEPSLDRLNGFLLALAPDFFAASAYLHFSEPGNGCAMVDRIVTGAFRFPDLDRY